MDDASDARITNSGTVATQIAVGNNATVETRQRSASTTARPRLPIPAILISPFNPLPAPAALRFMLLPSALKTPQ